MFSTRAFSPRVPARSKYKPSPAVAAASGADQEKGLKGNINLFCGVFRQRSRPFCVFVTCLADGRSELEPWQLRKAKGCARGIWISSRLAAAVLPIPLQITRVYRLARDSLGVTSASVTSATVMQIRIYQPSRETFPGPRCSEACDSRIPGRAAAEASARGHVRAVAWPRRTWQTDTVQIICPAGLCRELLAGEGFVQRLAESFSALCGGRPLQMQGKRRLVAPKGRSWAKRELPGQTEEAKLGLRLELLGFP